MLIDHIYLIMIIEKFNSAILENSSFGKETISYQKKSKIIRNVSAKMFHDVPVHLLHFENNQTIKFSSDSQEVPIFPFPSRTNSKINSFGFNEARTKLDRSGSKAQTEKVPSFLGKRDLLSSSLVCGKCKHKLRRGAKVVSSSGKNLFRIAISNAIKEIDGKRKSSVFERPANLPQTLFDSAQLDQLDSRDVVYSLSEKFILNQVAETRPINRALVILFLKGKLTRELFDSLSHNEQVLVRTLLFVKNGASKRDTGQARDLEFTPAKRRTEENIKFIFIRAIKYLMKAFEKRLFHEVRKLLKKRFRKLRNKDKLNYAFFGFYFGHESENLGTPIDQFMLPKKTKKPLKNSKNQFTSISKQYLQLVSVNPNFLRDLRFYLKHFFMKEMLADTLKKVRIILGKTIERRSGFADERASANSADFERVLRNTHIPWNIHELRFGLEDLKNYLRL